MTTALHEVSYGSSSRLYEKSDAQLGMTPATYRRGGRGMNISYTIRRCSLGRVLVAATERGISAVYLGDRDSDLAAALRKEYPHAEIRQRLGRALEVGARDRAASGRLESATWTCRRTWWPPRSSGASGRRCDPFRRARRAPTREVARIDRPAQRDARRGPCLRDKSRVDRGAVPPRGAHRRIAGRLSLGTANARNSCSSRERRESKTGRAVQWRRLQPVGFRQSDASETMAARLAGQTAPRTPAAEAWATKPAAELFVVPCGQ